MSDIRISARNLSKRFMLGTHPTAAKPHMTEWMRRGLERLLGQGKAPAARPPAAHEFWALRDVSFDLHRGERLGIVGRNGAGKSTLLKILARLIHPTEGEVRIRGRVTALLEVGTGFNEALTGRENVYLSASVHGLTRQEISARFDEIVDFSGVGEFIEEPVKTYSSGMRSRLGFAVAAHLEPDILILDEVLAVGDMAFIQKCLRKVEGLTAGGRTVIFVSHSISDVVRFCDRGFWLDQGRIVMQGPAREVAEAYAQSMLGLVAEAKVPKPAPAVVGRTAEPAAEAPAATTAGAAPAPADLRDHPERPAAEITGCRLIDTAGRVKPTFFRQEAFQVEMRFRALRSDLPLVTVVHILKEGIHVLSSHPVSALQPEQDREYQATLEIPALLLNQGIYHFSVAVVTPVSPVLRHAQLDLVCSCLMVDRVNESNLFAGNYRGTVRPSLAWATRLQPD